MTSTRIASGVIFAVVFLTGLFVRPLFWIPALIIAASAAMGVWEFMHLGRRRPPAGQLAVSLAGAAALLLDGYFYALEHGVAIIACLVVVALVAVLAVGPPEAAALAGRTIAGPIYVALPFALMMAIWQGNLIPGSPFPNAGAHYLIFLVIVTWASDVGGYFIGRAFGRHKLAPQVSPGKSLEGFIGGMAFTFAVAIAAKQAWNNIDALFSWVDVVALALVFSLLGPLGDLSESLLKREAHVKDSGRTFTGHGGMLDIVDSLLFTTIFYYAYLSLFHPYAVQA